MRDVQDAGGACSFCPGNEHLTPRAVLESTDSNGIWQARVFHDRAPLFRVEGGEDRRGEGMFNRMNNIGAHEIVVETPLHGVTLAELPVEQISRVIELCRDRIIDLKRDPRFRYVSLFKDQHAAAPTLQGHSYSQILASPVLPQLLEIEFRWSRAHFLRKERCLYCDVVQQEIQQEKRVVDLNGDFLAICPFGSRWSYELRILPLEHSSSFETTLLEPGRTSSLAPFLKSCLQRVEKLSQTLHLVVHTEPNLAAKKPMKEWWTTLPEDYHWHIEIQPDVEGRRRYLGTEGFYFNPIPAEQAALVLRALEPGAEPDVGP